MKTEVNKIRIVSLISPVEQIGVKLAEIFMNSRKNIVLAPLCDLASNPFLSSNALTE